MSFDQINAFILDLPIYVINGLLWLVYSLADSLVFDVFPATLDGFYNLECGDGSCRQSWGGGTVQFPILRDADGDALPTGADPDDRRWDADFDGRGDIWPRNGGSDRDADRVTHRRPEPPVPDHGA